MSRIVVTAGINYGLAIVGAPPTIAYSNAYTFTFKSFAGSPPYKFHESGTLPTGFTFTDNGDGTATLAGTTSTVADFPISVTLSDGGRNVVTGLYVLSVQPLPLSLSGHLAGGTAGAAASGGYSASGGVPPYTFTIPSGVFPTTGGINTSTGAALGNWSAINSYSWDVTVTDSASVSTTISDSCNTTSAPITITGSFTSPATIGSSYSHNVSLSGGTGSYSNPQIASGTLPAGLSLSIAGSTLTLSGTPTTVANYSFGVTVDSGASTSSPSSQTVNVQADAVALSIYNKIATAAGGHGAYWDLSESTVLAGSLRADQANGAFTLGVTFGGVSIVNGPRGAGDNSSTQGGGGYLLASRTVGDDLDVPAAPGQKYCLFGFMKINSSQTTGIGGTYTGASQPAGGCMFVQIGGNMDGYSGDQPSGLWCHADVAIPDYTNWHFYTAWRDDTDGKMRMSVDGGTPAVSSNTCQPNPNSIPMEILAGGFGSPDFAASRWGYIKGNYLTGTEQTWMANSGSGRNWAEIKALAGH